ncbi:cytochrome c oxidase subunit VIb [Monoraphidium neglectum]|uniref:Cytochrome c oxidase subunit VIb n=1 Tax=Monoraphidium neglectum TaxID=145388 RepID=A0A0D2MXY7_9CHLO|nr:cytochrome c oxidase subunit VIb [Monoraphidium neglectum]KIZ05207.1 cytochrome c oxidase subunit VIb [Monoraphidium neglectum]|eukprot:XP_013904226.1 cytochrome c oxidase subunit VIb [Monoraphidium neglectum]
MPEEVEAAKAELLSEVVEKIVSSHMKWAVSTVGGLTRLPGTPLMQRRQQQQQQQQQRGESIGDEVLVNEVVTAPYDPRFPATNQARHCFVRYNEYYKCVFERGTEADRCNFYKRAYESMCPADWVEEWEELREKGLWMGKY